MRLFIAIELSKEASSELDRVQKEIKVGTLTKQHHLTLKFLGESDPEKVIPLLKKVKFEAFEISLSDMGFFPNEDFVRIVWVGVKPEEEVVELQKRVEKELEPLKIKNNFDFHPHITLSRIRFIKTKPKKIEVNPVKSEVKCFKLIKSELTPHGPVYTTIEEFK